MIKSVPIYDIDDSSIVVNTDDFGGGSGGPGGAVNSVNGKTGDVVITKTDVGLGNVDNTSDNDKPISTATQAALNNKADLVGGKVPSGQLPSYVDDILEFANLASFPVIGETGKIYTAIDSGINYRWSGSVYTPSTDLSGYYTKTESNNLIESRINTQRMYLNLTDGFSPTSTAASMLVPLSGSKTFTSYLKGTFIGKNSVRIKFGENPPIAPPPPPDEPTTPAPSYTGSLTTGWPTSPTGNISGIVVSNQPIPGTVKVIFTTPTGTVEQIVNVNTATGSFSVIPPVGSTGMEVKDSNGNKITGVNAPPVAPPPPPEEE